MAWPAAPALSPPELLVGAAVDGTAGWRAVRSVLTDPMHHGAGRLLAPPDRGPHPLGFELVRSKLKPGRKLTAYYRPRAAGPVSAHVAVSWSSDGRVSLLRFPADPAMPQLARLSDGAGLAALVESFHSPLAGPVPEVHVVRYQPGQRHVLLARSARWPAVYVKTDRDDRGASAVPLAGILAAALARSCPSACVAEPLGHAPAERASLWWRAPGRSVAILVAHGRSAAPLAAQAGRAARAIHDAGTSSVRLPPVPVHDARAEAAATQRAGEHIGALLPSLGRGYQRLVADVIEALDRFPGEPPTLVHGDLKAENLLADGHRLRLLDLDRVCLAEPAHDLGKFLADLRWWTPAADVATLEAAFRDGYGACDPLRWRRAELLAVLLQLRLVARRAPLHDSRWPVLVRDRTRRAVAAFDLARRR